MVYENIITRKKSIFNFFSNEFHSLAKQRTPYSMCQNDERIGKKEPAFLRVRHIISTTDIVRVNG